MKVINILIFLSPAPQIYRSQIFLTMGALRCGHIPFFVVLSSFLSLSNSVDEWSLSWLPPA
jgi:hypothetical protein